MSWQLSYRIALQTGSKYLESQLIELRKKFESSDLADPHISKCLNELDIAVSKNQSNLTVPCETLVKCLQYIESQNSLKGSLTAELRATVKRIEHELSLQEFLAIFGDYTENAVQNIICKYEEDFKNGQVPWVQFHGQLMHERRKYLKVFQKKNPTETAESERFVAALYKQPQHKRLAAYAYASREWTTVECERLFTFTDVGNQASHSGVNQGSFENRLSLLKLHKTDLTNIGAPAGYEKYGPVILKAIEELEAEMTSPDIDQDIDQDTDAPHAGEEPTNA